MIVIEKGRSILKIKYFVLSIAVALFLLTSAHAAPSCTRSIGDGISITFKGVEREHGDFIVAAYSVLADRDTVITVDPHASSLFDPDGLQFVSGYTSIIGHTVANRREIIANVPTSVLIRYFAGSSYEITPTYPCVNLVVNNKNIKFRDVPCNP